jgi:hypothetical protein
MKATWQLNHYAIQSFDWFMAVKARRGDVSTKSLDGVRNEEYFKAYDQNDVRDTQLLERQQAADHLFGGLAHIAPIASPSHRLSWGGLATTATATTTPSCVWSFPGPNDIEASVPIMQCQARLRQLLACAGDVRALSRDKVAALVSARLCHKNGTIAQHVRLIPRNGAAYFVAVGSVIHVRGEPFDYAVRAGFRSRSKASASERLAQMLQRTIPSIRAKIPDAHIVVLEQGGPLSVEEKARLSEAADTLVVMRDFDPYAEHFVDGPYKGLDAAYTLFQFATALHHQGVPFKQWFKVSGRYWL